VNRIIQISIWFKRYCVRQISHAFIIDSRFCTPNELRDAQCCRAKAVDEFDMQQRKMVKLDSDSEIRAQGFRSIVFSTGHAGLGGRYL
jgi:hypothetical protein